MNMKRETKNEEHSTEIAVGNPSDTEPQGKPLEPWMCGARRRGTNQFCRAPKVKGAKRCRIHGGAKGSGRPIEHGLYSKMVREDEGLGEYVAAIRDLSGVMGLSMSEEIITARARLLKLQLERDPKKQSPYHETLYMQAIDRLRRTEMDLGGMVSAETAAEVLRLSLVVVVKELRRELGDGWEAVWQRIRTELGRHGLGGTRVVADEARDRAESD